VNTRQIFTAALSLAAAVGLRRNPASSAASAIISEPDFPWHFPLASRVADPIPSWPHRQSYRRQVRDARRRRNVQKRGGAK